jgi:hypothetical protein
VHRTTFRRAVAIVTRSVTLPLMLLGGLLMDLAPRWLHLASRVNPLTYFVEAERTIATRKASV